MYNKAVEALNGIFFVGIQEAYDISIQIMLRELHVPVQGSIIITNPDPSYPQLIVRTAEFLLTLIITLLSSLYHHFIFITTWYDKQWTSRKNVTNKAVRP